MRRRLHCDTLDCGIMMSTIPNSRRQNGSFDDPDKERQRERERSRGGADYDDDDPTIPQDSPGAPLSHHQSSFRSNYSNYSNHSNHSNPTTHWL